jgi:hypothetical protein
MINVNGLKNEPTIDCLKQMMLDEKIEILFLIETHLTVEKQKPLQRRFIEYDVFVKNRKSLKRKQYQQRGGIVCIAKKGTVTEDKTECDDLMSIRWGEWRIVCVYFVPRNSPYFDKNEERMIELQERIISSEDKFMLMTDSNAWVGERPSTIETERGGEMVFERKSEHKETNKEGEWFVSNMDSCNVIILNGTRNTALYTYDHPGRDAKSVVDYIAVNERSHKYVTDIAYTDCREILSTDHNLISVLVRCEKDKQPENNLRTIRTKKKKRQPQSAMQQLKTVTRTDPFWSVLKSKCERQFVEYKTKETSTIDEDYNEFKRQVEETVGKAIKEQKPIATTLKARLRSTQGIVTLRILKNRLYRDMKKEKDEERKKRLRLQTSKVNKQLKQRIREAIISFKCERVREIENLEREDCRRMWKELKELSGWRTKSSLPDSVLDEKQREVSGDQISEVWKESFRELGIEDTKDNKFEEEFCTEVERRQQEIERDTYKADNKHEELDKEITFNEIDEAIKRLKVNKAPGLDQIVAELLQRGGDQLKYAIRALCCKAWEKEKVPEDWTKGIIFPIYKDGDKKDTGNYRGITLLSIVGKVYTQVLNERLMTWSEKNKILVEEQGGFRPERGCPDQLFTLVEILKNRGKKETFCCFIDVKKAFDRVYRGGLWCRLAEEGVKGKMWRVLRSIYSTVQSCVRVDDKLTDWFSLETGVRQGCILSPLLYAMFINGLVKELNKLGTGVAISVRDKLSSLLYADDIVLITENRYELQMMLDKVTEYAKKWRFELNNKKSEVVVFGSPRAPRNIPWKLGGKEIKQVTHYKYLGIELTRTLRWSKYIKRILAKARRNMTQALTMGITGGFLTPRLSNIIWMSLVRSIIEYGCELWGDESFVEFEKLQLEMGKRILRTGKTTPDEVVRGELGWERQRTRMDEMRLRYWGRITKMKEDRIVKIVYNNSKEMLEQEENELKHNPEMKLTETWCKYTRDLLYSLNFHEQWRTNKVEPEWEDEIRKRLHEREQIRWRAQCLFRPKLRTYSIVKKELRPEPYLEIPNRRGLPEYAKVRGGNSRLRIEQGRYRKEMLEERLCVFCEMKVIEDEYHFLLDCPLYNTQREEMWKEFEKETDTSRSVYATKEEKLNALIGDRFIPKQLSPSEKTDDRKRRKYREEIRKFCKKLKPSVRFVSAAMNIRRAIEKSREEQKS